MGLDGSRTDTEWRRQAVGRDALSYTPQDLHLPRCQCHRIGALGEGSLFSYTPENVWDHLPRHWALASDGRPKCPLQLSRPDVLEDVSRTAGPHHSQEIVT